MMDHMRRRDSLAGSLNPHRPYRNPERGMLFGVCAGLADYFRLPVWQARLVAIVALLLFTVQALLVYFVGAMVMGRRPERLYGSPDEEEFWRDVSRAPDQTFYSLRHKFRDLERRLASMETLVTSEEFKFDREIRGLDR